MYQEVEGNLITLAKEGMFDVITHGCNCLCQMGAGIAPQMAKAFGCDEFEMEDEKYRGDINKLGTIDYEYWTRPIEDWKKDSGPMAVAIVNSYTQYNYGKNHTDGVNKPLDYEALTLCMRKINRTFKGQRIGLPQIGCGLAGGKWNVVKHIVQNELKDCDVTVVIFKK